MPQVGDEPQRDTSRRQTGVRPRCQAKPRGAVRRISVSYWCQTMVSDHEVQRDTSRRQTIAQPSCPRAWPAMGAWPNEPVPRSQARQAESVPAASDPPPPPPPFPPAFLVSRSEKRSGVSAQRGLISTRWHATGCCACVGCVCMVACSRLKSRVEALCGMFRPVSPPNHTYRCSMFHPCQPLKSTKLTASCFAKAGYCNDTWVAQRFPLNGSLRILFVKILPACVLPHPCRAVANPAICECQRPSRKISEAYYRKTTA